MDILAGVFAVFPSSLGAAAIAPSLLVLWTLATMDNRREPARVVLVAFMLGATSAFLISYLHPPFARIADLNVWPILQGYLQATLNVAAPEEAIKLLVIVFFCSSYIAYDHPMEGVVYGAAVGLGFAAYENLFYLASNSENWKTLALVRGLVTVPVHGALGVIIGIFAVKAKFGTVSGRTRRRGGRLLSYFFGWAIATILHGLFDFPLLLQPQLALEQSAAAIWWLGFGLSIACIATLVAARIVYLARRSQTTIHNSFTHGRRFQNHPWRATGIIAIIVFIAALAILDLLRG